VNILNKQSQSRELAEHKLDLMGVQVVRWVKGGSEPAGDYTFYGNVNADHHLSTGFFLHKGTSAVKRVEFVSERMLTQRPLV
jgi:hypothetical protein